MSEKLKDKVFGILGILSIPTVMFGAIMSGDNFCVSDLNFLIGMGIVAIGFFEGLAYMVYTYVPYVDE